MVGALNLHSLTDKTKESLVTAIYLGGIFILLAVVYFINISYSLWDRLINFFGSFMLAQVPGTSVSLPAPAIPYAHAVLYNAVFQFCLGLGILEIVILAFRIVIRSPMARRAETIENIVFWLGTSYLTVAYLVTMTLQSEWFVFWAGVILIAGLSLVARSFILLANRWI